MNTFLNENAHDIIREVKPQFAQEIDRLVTRVFSEAIAALPVDLWEDLAKQLGLHGKPDKPSDKPTDKPTDKPSTETNEVPATKKAP